VRYPGGDKRREAPILQCRLRKDGGESLEYRVVIIIGLLRTWQWDTIAHRRCYSEKSSRNGQKFHFSPECHYLFRDPAGSEGRRKYPGLAHIAVVHAGAVIFGLILYQTINVTCAHEGHHNSAHYYGSTLGGNHHRPFWFIRVAPRQFDLAATWVWLAADRWIFNCQVIVDG